MTNEQPGPEQRPGPGRSRTDLRGRLENLDRAWVPRLADRLDRVLQPFRGRAEVAGRRVDLPPNARRVIGALAVLLVGCALALLLLGT